MYLKPVTAATSLFNISSDLQFLLTHKVDTEDTIHQFEPKLYHHAQSLKFVLAIHVIVTNFFFHTTKTKIEAKQN